MTHDDERKPGRAADEPAWIRTLSRTEAEAGGGLLAEVLSEIADRSGSVAHILLSQSLHPEGLRDHYRLYRTVMFGRGALSRADRESIAVTVSAVNGCHY